MTELKHMTKVLAVALALGVALSACDRRSDATGSAAQPSTSEQRSAGAGDRGTDSSGSSGSSSSAAGMGSSAGQAVDDASITAKAKTALLADSTVKGTDVKVETEKGTVVLSGAVDSRDQIAKAESIVKKIDGVKTVDNRITLKQ